jgi:nitrate/nitrite-specific signal transduction histidine kinase
MAEYYGWPSYETWLTYTWLSNDQFVDETCALLAKSAATLTDAADALEDFVEEHLTLLEEAGLAATLDWYIPTVERQTGLAVHYEKSGAEFPVETAAGVHLYRVVQESLNNVNRHAETKEAWVRLAYGTHELLLEIEDHGKGVKREKDQHGIGMVAMRERAELIGGTLEYEKPDAGGTRVKLRVMREKVEAHVG